ncbi:MAG: hypothetical protein ACKODX_02955 [Gemmata sp.]
MSRDPYDDYQHDDPDRAERERAPGDDRRAERAARVAGAARRRVARPAVFIIINALSGFAFAAALSVPLLFQPELIVQFMREMAAQQPPGPARRDAERQADEVEQRIQQDPMALRVEAVLELGFLLVVNTAAIVCGLSMRKAGNYALAITGSVLTLVPVTGFCCANFVTGVPVGLWGLIVLLDPAVRAGFAARRDAAAYSPDRY